VVGNRPSQPQRDSEPAALLVYPEVILATSGYGQGQTNFLRPGNNHALEIVIRDEHLVEVTTLNMNIVALKPVTQPTVAPQALRSLPWIRLRERDAGGQS